MTKILPLVLVAFFSTACIKTADQVNREKRFENMSEQMKDSQGLVANLVGQLKDMQNQLDRMTGKIEELEHRQSKVNPENLKKMDENIIIINTQQESQSSQLTTIQNELKDQRAFLEKVTAGLAELKSAPAPTKSSKKKSVKDDLNEALDLIKSDDYADARKLLEPLIDHSDLTPGDRNKVLFGLGKVEYYTNHNDKALVYFSKIYTKFPKATLAPSSLLFIGRSLKKLGKKDEASEAFNQVVSQYPGSKEANDAKKEL